MVNDVDVGIDDSAFFISLDGECEVDDVVEDDEGRFVDDDDDDDFGDDGDGDEEVLLEIRMIRQNAQYFMMSVFGDCRVCIVVSNN